MIGITGCHLIFPFETSAPADQGVAAGDSEAVVLDRAVEPGDGGGPTHGDSSSPSPDQPSTGTEICDNGLDDDGDGLDDCSDPQCFGKPPCGTDASIACVAQTCPAGMLCDIHGCQPGASGFCVFDPPTCPPGNGPVCGCDIYTYDSDCLRIKAKVALMHDQGGCK
jgi:hypothetical protein